MEGSRLRVFAALELPEDTAAMIYEWQKPLMNKYPSLKWVSTDRMHLTLRFFGDIDESVIRKINAELATWKPGPLDFSLTEAGFFGRRRSPSVYWLGGVFPKEIKRMAEGLASIPDDKGRTDEREYIPHLTVARRRRSSSVPTELVLAGEIPGVFRSAALFNSRLTPNGPEYRYLYEYELT
ncbi:MAG: RNA 2',3'-cyclic phosphodiesterase [Candidatus Aegiribacteria sp.]|nr:RNA 2',3'-cyclic phosphodiesterase [Candidatus Aegiribacteria sp.]MBD3294055.1 RNA 2',3'-cyclic phosphodiesterase [Candidatus Fermentibacteria bacterium]